ncbi:penicillin-binding protein activator [Polycladidibacter stylochi]|uniref:penicillin-binding protein activator n=1 Tax=Polycladidibacter stylochi TaxID=1807766 RepID=UPI00082D698A|nr:penicillin-binding protein activator [Pseudovibrio stylochi]
MSGIRFALNKRIFRQLLSAAMLLMVGLVSGCMNPAVYDGPNYAQQTINPVVHGRTIGEGSVRVGLLLPLSKLEASQQQAPVAVAQNVSAYPQQTTGTQANEVANLFENAAKMALTDFQGADIQFLVKDTQGTQDGAEAAARAAISEGAELLIGPIYGPAVKGASRIARRAGVPVIGFSSDTNAASQGTYLLSFLPESDVTRIISFAHEQERVSYAAMLPNNSYGAVVEASFRQAVGSFGGRIVTIERYTPGDVDDIRAKASKIGKLASQVDALFIPEGGGVPPFVMQVLTENGASTGSIKILGSGLWNTPDLLKSPVMAGSWFPAPDDQNFKRFAERYQQAYGQVPPRNASLAYDAAILAAGLVRSAGADRFTPRVLTNQDGFLGIDGIFRFRQDGIIQRGLAVYAVSSKGAAKVVSPAPRTFSNHF